MGARYSRQSGYTISKRSTPPRRTQRTVPQKISFGPTAAKYFGLGILAVIALVMLTQKSTSATGAYQESSLRDSIGQVNNDIDSLQVEARRAQSLEALKTSTPAQTMQPDSSVTYVESGKVAGASTVAPSVQVSPSPTATP